MRNRVLIFVLAAAGAAAQTVETVKVVAKPLERQLRLPGEFLPYRRVALHARVTAFVESVEVDRGSVVRKGQLLVQLSAPELAAQVAEAEAKAQAVESQRAEVAAKAAAAEATWKRLRAASATEGAISGHELDLARKAYEAAMASGKALEDSARAARAHVEAVRKLESYLKIAAPFDGVITARNVHPGALAGPSQPQALLELEQNSRLRLVVPVPEPEVPGIVAGTRVSFRVPAWPGRSFQGTVARIPRSMDARTRTMAVELDVANPRAELAPGMYPELAWPARSPGAALFVPATGVVTTTERAFVIRVTNGQAEYVTVSKGAAYGDLVEVTGPLNPGDEIVRRGSDEIRPGSTLSAKNAGK